VSDYCLTPNDQYEELDISKNSGKPYKNTNFDKKDILANHKSLMSSLNIPINEENHYATDTVLLIDVTT
jgi:hypothetical protein